MSRPGGIGGVAGTGAAMYGHAAALAVRARPPRLDQHARRHGSRRGLRCISADSIGTARSSFGRAGVVRLATNHFDAEEGRNSHATQ